jgi:hypothetical protein
MMKTVIAHDPASGFGEARFLCKMLADGFSSLWFFPNVAPQLRIPTEAAQSYEQTGYGHDIFILRRKTGWSIPRP